MHQLNSHISSVLIRQSTMNLEEHLIDRSYFVVVNSMDGDEIITDVTEPISLGDGPHWSDEEQVLYFVDILGKAFIRFEPETKNLVRLQLNDTVSSVIPVRNRPGEFVMAYGRKITLLKWDGKSQESSMETLFSVETEKEENRFNDGKADKKGRFFIGSMHDPPEGKIKKLGEGSLYRVADCGIATVLTDVSISNGIAWNHNNTVMYYIDSKTRQIDMFDYDIETGEATNRRLFYHLESNRIKGNPDGMTIDKDGNVWVACWNGSQLIQVNENGQLMRTVMIPAQYVCSLTWGGKNLSTLYVTTMYMGLTEEERKTQPKAGAVFAITGLETSGYAPGNTVEMSCSASKSPDQSSTESKIINQPNPQIKSKPKTTSGGMLLWADNFQHFYLFLICLLL